MLCVGRCRPTRTGHVNQHMGGGMVDMYTVEGGSLAPPAGARMWLLLLRFQRSTRPPVAVHS